MARTSFNANIESIKFFARQLNDPIVERRIANIAKEKGAAGIIAQSIAETFDAEGPGWQPLKNKTIRTSVKGKAKKAVADMTDKELERHEKFARKKGASQIQPFRRILQRTGLLKKTVTTPGWTGTRKKTKGSNVYKVDGNVITWGTDLVYAKVQNEGGGRSNLPPRPFLKPLNAKWQRELEEWAKAKIITYLRESWGAILK